MTIFRMVRHLERQGHRITIWVLDPLRSRHSADLRDDVLKHYQTNQGQGVAHGQLLFLQQR